MVLPLTKFTYLYMLFFIFHSSLNILCLCICNHEILLFISTIDEHQLDQEVKKKRFSELESKGHLIQLKWFTDICAIYANQEQKKKQNNNNTKRPRKCYITFSIQYRWRYYWTIVSCVRTPCETNCHRPWSVEW